MSDPVSPPGFAIEHTAQGDGAVTLSLAGELDITSAGGLEQRLQALLEQDRTSRIVLDLGGLSFIDSTGLRAIVIGADACKSRGCELLLVPGPPAVQRLFELTGLIDVLPFEAHEPDAAQP